MSGSTSSSANGTRTRATQHVLDEKAAYVEKHRARLLLEARKAREEAVGHLDETIGAVESARADVVASLEAERWAGEYPGPEADAASLRLGLIRGGRLVKAIPELRGQLAAVQAVALLREDSAWLGNVTAEEQRKRDELDPDEEAVWWQSPEGQEAIARKSKRTFERVMGARYRNTKTAGWES